MFLAAKPFLYLMVVARYKFINYFFINNKFDDIEKIFLQASRKICGAVKSGVKEFPTTGLKIVTGS